MRLFGIIGCFVVVAMDIVAGILGIKAEAAQDQGIAWLNYDEVCSHGLPVLAGTNPLVKHVRLWLFECKEPSHDAFILGLAAAGLLALAHVFANLLGGCSVCSQEELSKSSPSRLCSLGCLLLTWVALAVGLGLLVIGTMSNHKSRTSCGLTHQHYFSIGGILCFVHAGFAVGYYITATASY